MTTGKEEVEETAIINQTFTPLIEKALRKDGTIPIKVIAPGWGSSGYYSKEVIERDIPKAFPVGTHMYWNHPTATQEANRPERDLSDLAAVIVSKPVFQENGAQGAGIYADAKVFGNYANAIDEMAPHIGVSIYGGGKTSVGEAEGQKGRIVEEITAGHSVDFVTKPGAGGAIVSLFESVRGGEPLPPIESINEVDNMDKLKEVQDQLAEAQKVIERQSLQIEKLQERQLIADAKAIVTAKLNESQLPIPTKSRLTRQLLLNVSELGESFNKLVDDAIAEAKEEVAAITQSGQIREMGSVVNTFHSDIDLTKLQEQQNQSMQILMGETYGN